MNFDTPVLEGGGGGGGGILAKANYNATKPYSNAFAHTFAYAVCTHSLQRISSGIKRYLKAIGFGMQSCGSCSQSGEKQNRWLMRCQALRLYTQLCGDHMQHLRCRNSIPTGSTRVTENGFQSAKTANWWKSANLELLVGIVVLEPSFYR